MSSFCINYYIDIQNLCSTIKQIMQFDDQTGTECGDYINFVFFAISNTFFQNGARTYFEEIFIITFDIMALVVKNIKGYTVYFVRVHHTKKVHGNLNCLLPRKPGLSLCLSCVFEKSATEFPSRYSITLATLNIAGPS